MFKFLIETYNLKTEVDLIISDNAIFTFLTRAHY